LKEKKIGWWGREIHRVKLENLGSFDGNFDAVMGMKEKSSMLSMLGTL